MEAKQEHIELIIRYFTGESSPEEILLISNLLQSDTSFQQEFIEQKEIWEQFELISIKNSIEIDTEWNKIKHTISNNETKVIEPGSEKVRNKFSLLLKIAAVFIFIFISAFIIYSLTNNNENNFIQLASNHSVIEKTLPDGTIVNLNTNSNITFPRQFSANKRTVVFKGQAIFNVAPDKTKPFIIDAGNVFIEVVGTSFMVKTDADGKTDVVVTTGKVLVYKKSNPLEKVLLIPGERASFTSSNEPITKTKNSDENYNAWKTHRLVFNDANLETIVNQLNAIYEAKIIIENKNIASCKVTVTFENQSLEAVLKVLEATINIQVSQSKNHFVISGNGCN